MPLRRHNFLLDQYGRLGQYSQDLTVDATHFAEPTGIVLNARERTTFHRFWSTNQLVSKELYHVTIL
jgi:hypothetical protein